MKHHNLILLMLIAILTTVVFAFPETSQAANPTSIAPTSVINTQGITVGPLSRLAQKNLTGTQNNTTTYIKLTTPESKYVAQYSFMLPSSITSASIQTLQVKANYRGPTKTAQVWRWDLYNWKTDGWVKIGNNATSDGVNWDMLTFSVANPAKFVNSSGRITLRVESSTGEFDAALDYMVVQVTTAPVTQPPVNQPPPSSSVPTGPSGKWKLIFGDDFNGTSVNTANWSLNWYGPTNTSITMPLTRPQEQSCYDPSLVSVTNGSLLISAVSRPKCQTWNKFSDYTLNYASGIIHTRNKFSFRYGAMETRIWVPAAGNGKIANWPMFFADNENWPQDGEIDVLEGLGGSACYHYHYNGGGPGGCTSSTGPGGAANAWHTYTADWEPGVITWYYDGQKVWSYTSGVSSATLYLHAVFGVGKDSATAVPTTMKIDYIRAWQTAP